MADLVTDPMATTVCVVTYNVVSYNISLHGMYVAVSKFILKRRLDSLSQHVDYMRLVSFPDRFFPFLFVRVWWISVGRFVQQISITKAFLTKCQ